MCPTPETRRTSSTMLGDVGVAPQLLDDEVNALLQERGGGRVAEVVGAP